MANALPNILKHYFPKTTWFKMVHFDYDLKKHTEPNNDYVPLKHLFRFFSQNEEN